MPDSYNALRARLEARHHRQRRNWWRVLLFVGGLALGVGLGLYLGWVAPARFTRVKPAALTESYQRDLTLMIAAAYEQDGDLPAAWQRLVALQKNDTRAWLLAITVDEVLNGDDERAIRQLVRLAGDAGIESPVITRYLAEP